MPNSSPSTSPSKASPDSSSRPLKLPPGLSKPAWNISSASHLSSTRPETVVPVPMEFRSYQVKASDFLRSNFGSIGVAAGTPPRCHSQAGLGGCRRNQLNDYLMVDRAPVAPING